MPWRQHNVTNLLIQSSMLLKQIEIILQTVFFFNNNWFPLFFKTLYLFLYMQKIERRIILFLDQEQIIFLAFINLNKPQDQEWHDQLGTEKRNYVANFQDHHLHTAFGSKSCCSLNERHWNAGEGKFKNYVIETTIYLCKLYENR